MMMSSHMLPVALVVFLSLATHVKAFSTGAAACPPNQAAVATSHSIGLPQETTLEASGFELQGFTNLTAGEPAMLTLTGIPVFAGFLIRVEGDAVIEPNGDPNVQDASICPEGVTHNNNNDKTSVTAMLLPLSSGTITLDVTVVVAHNPAEGNIFSYSQLQADAVGDVVLEAPASAPVINAQRLWTVHGALMGLSWVVLIPLGVGSSIARSCIPGEGIWFQIHRALNTVGVLATIAGFGVAVYLVENVSGGVGHFSPEFSAHRLAGLLVTIFAFLQGLWGMFRPHATEKDEEKTVLRSMFEIGHRLLGLSLLGVAWWNVYTGIGLFTSFIGALEAAESTTIALWVLIAVLGGVPMIIGAYSMVCGSPR